MSFPEITEMGKRNHTFHYVSVNVLGEPWSNGEVVVSSSLKNSLLFLKKKNTVKAVYNTPNGVTPSWSLHMLEHLCTGRLFCFL